MRMIVAAIAAGVLAHNAHAAENVLLENTAKALAAGDSAAVVKALIIEVGRSNVIAAQKLGLGYRDGDLIGKDQAKARVYLRLAAEPSAIRFYYKSGLPEAQYALAAMLRDGIGGKADAAEAVSWFELAAEQGYEQAQIAVAWMYMKGAGIKRNVERAFFWSSIAANRLTSAAQKEAEQLRDSAQNQLEPAQVAKARILVNDWKPKVS